MAEPLQILVIQEDAADRAALCRNLRAGGYEVHMADSGLQALERIGREPVDIVITDWTMPGLDGLQLCRSIRQRSTEPYIFTIVLTAPGDVVAVLSAGADDSITKPFDDNELLARVRAGERVVRLERALRRRNRELTALLEELQVASARLERTAATDPLTGLWNRRRFEEMFASEASWSQRNQKPMALALMDLDHFKQVIDRHGHLVGDRVLQAVSRILQAGVRAYDTVARLGGEEFGILFRSITAEQAERSCERIRTCLEMTPMGNPSSPFVVTASFGLTLLRPTEPAEFSALFARADRALYAAKHRGRNRTVAAPDEEASVRNPDDGQPHGVSSQFSWPNH